ncbi:MAG: hypothetical protein ACTSRZ_20105, partial [Promethearchaeota archaeon]
IANKSVNLWILMIIDGLILSSSIYIEAYLFYNSDSPNLNAKKHSNTFLNKYKNEEEQIKPNSSKLIITILLIIQSITMSIIFILRGFDEPYLHSTTALIFFSTTFLIYLVKFLSSNKNKYVIIPFLISAYLIMHYDLFSNFLGIAQRIAVLTILVWKFFEFKIDKKYKIVKCELDHCSFQKIEKTPKFADKREAKKLTQIQSKLEETQKDKIFLPTSLLIAVFGSNEFRTQDQIQEKSSNTTKQPETNIVSITSSNNNNKIQNQIEESENIKKQQIEKEQILNKETQTNKINKKLQKEVEQIDQALKQKAKEKIKNKIDKKKKLKQKIKLRELPNKIKKLFKKTEQTLKTKQIQLKPQLYKELSHDVEKEIQQESSNIKKYLRSLGKRKISSLSISIVSVLLIYFMGILFTSIDPTNYFWMYPPTVIFIVGFIGIIFNKKQVYSLLSISLIPSLIMCFIDLLNANYVFFAINCLTLIVGSYAIAKLETAEWDILLLDGCLYIFVIMISQINSNINFIQPYYETLGIFFYIFLAAGLLIIPLYSLFELKTTPAILTKTKFKSNSKSIINPTKFERKIYSKFGKNAITNNLDLILFAIIGIIISLTIVALTNQLSAIFSIPPWAIAAAIVALICNSRIISSILIAVMPSIALFFLFYLYPFSFITIYNIFIIACALYVLIKKKNAKYEFVLLFGLIISIISINYTAIIFNLSSYISLMLFLSIINSIIISSIVLLYEYRNVKKLKKQLKLLRLAASKQLSQPSQLSQLSQDKTMPKQQKSTPQKYNQNQPQTSAQNAIVNFDLSLTDSLQTIPDDEFIANTIQHLILLNQNLNNNPNINIENFQKTFVKWIAANSESKQFYITQSAFDWLKNQPSYSYLKPFEPQKLFKIIDDNKFDPFIFLLIYNSFKHNPKIFEAAKSISYALSANCNLIAISDLSWLLLEDFVPYAINKKINLIKILKNPNTYAKILKISPAQFPQFSFKFLVIPFKCPIPNYINIYKAEFANEKIQKLIKLAEKSNMNVSKLIKTKIKIKAPVESKVLSNTPAPSLNDMKEEKTSNIGYESFESDQTKPLVINLTHSILQLKVIQFLYSLITTLCFYYFIILPAINISRVDFIGKFIQLILFPVLFALLI